MILEKGNMWDVFEETDAFVITTNPIINSRGEVVMGRGIAKEAMERFPSIGKDFAVALDIAGDCFGQAPGVGHIGDYGLNSVPILWFMVKDHWKHHADLRIIKRSMHMLAAGAMYEPCKRFDLNFPGIGNGRLAREDVLPIIEQLPNNVHVWEYGTKSQ